MTSSSLASSMGVPEGNLHRLLRACAAVGLLQENQDDLGNCMMNFTHCRGLLECRCKTNVGPTMVYDSAQSTFHAFTKQYYDLVGE